MKKLKDFLWPLFFFCLGTISISGQTVLLREITTLFFGNEIFYGIGLGVWLLWVGLGAMLTRCKLRENRANFLRMTLGILFLGLPVLVILLRLLVARMILAGGLAGFGFSFLILSLFLFVFCFPLGVEFVCGCLFWQKETKKNVVNRAYFWETIGFAFGGLLFSFFLATTSFPFTPEVNRMSLAWRYPNLVETVNSNYQQIVVTKSGSQKNFFLGGSLAFTSQESYENQKLISLIAPFGGEKKRVLVMANPTIASDLQRRFLPEKTLSLEFDSELLNYEKDLIPSGVDIYLGDPRKFLRENNDKWDLIFFAPGSPQTLLANRYFTKECFDEIQNRLSQKGIFVLLFYLPTDYLSYEAARFGGSVYQTLKGVFSSLTLLAPEDQLLFLAGNSEVSLNKDRIDGLWKDYFWYQFQNPQRNEILKRLTEVKVSQNRDFEPVTFFYRQLFWQTIFNFRIPQLLVQITSVLPLALLIIFLIFFLGSGQKLRLGLLAASSSFILMSLEILVILFFQTKIGYLYSQASLIFAAVLLGMGLGVMLIRKLKNQNLRLNTLFVGYLPILFLLFLVSSGGLAGIFDQTSFWIVIIVSGGILGGAIFAFVNRLYLGKGENTGFIYAFDLFGGFFGAILTSSFLLPSLGVSGLTFGLTGLAIINILTPIARHPG